MEMKSGTDSKKCSTFDILPQKQKQHINVRDLPIKCDLIGKKKNDADVAQQVTIIMIQDKK